MKNNIDDIQLKNRVLDCIRGSLMAGAAGDALGYPVEFTSRSSILSTYGNQGITQFVIEKKGKTLVSDDTHMTLFTANGLLVGLTKGRDSGLGTSFEDDVANSYLDWYYTQTGSKPSGDGGDDVPFTWLRDLPELAHQRAPGITCMNACESMMRHEQPWNNSKGCGGVMRVAPMGLLDAAFQVNCGNGLYSPTRLAEAGAKIAKMTHLHPLGYLPAALLTLLISRVVPLAPEDVKASIADIVNDGLHVMMQMYGDEYLPDKAFLKILTLKAMDLAKSDTPDALAIAQLGEGWTAEEAWVISLFCVVRHIDSARDAIIAAVNHNGDSDSTGAITGNIMGAVYGYEAIKQERLFCPADMEFESTIEMADIILALADDLFTGCVISLSAPFDTPEKKQWHERYCEMKPSGINNE